MPLARQNLQVKKGLILDNGEDENESIVAEEEHLSALNYSKNRLKISLKVLILESEMYINW